MTPSVQMTLIICITVVVIMLISKRKGGAK